MLRVGEKKSKRIVLLIVFECVHDFRCRVKCLTVLFCTVTASKEPTTPPPHPPFPCPNHSDSWKQNSSDSFCCFSFSQLPNPPRNHTSHNSLVTLTVVIGSAGIIQRLDIIYCLPCTIPPPSLTHFLNRTRCPADEVIILEILFLLLIPPFYEQLLFIGGRQI